MATTKPARRFESGPHWTPGFPERKPLVGIVQQGAPARLRFQEAAEWGWSLPRKPSVALFKEAEGIFGGVCHFSLASLWLWLFIRGPQRGIIFRKPQSGAGPRRTIPAWLQEIFGFRFSFEFRFRFWFTVVHVSKPEI